MRTGGFFCTRWFCFVGKRDYAKVPKEVVEQIKQLKCHGMQFRHEEVAQKALHRHNYYRLRGYWITFEEENPEDQRFRGDTYFEDILQLYRFDEALRHLISFYLSKLEVSFRTAFAYYFSLRVGPLGYKKACLFRNGVKGRPWSHGDELYKLKESVGKSHENFARKLRKKYNDLPFWAIVELTTFGQIARWYENLAHPDIRNEIASFHGISGIENTGFFSHFLSSASSLRNTCAHHGRLTYRVMGNSLRQPKGRSVPSEIIDSWIGKPKGRDLVQNLLGVLHYVMHKSQEDITLKQALMELFLKYSISPTVIGLPKDWEQMPVWSLSTKVDAR